MPSPFERAHQAIDAQDVETLAAELDAHPGLVEETGGANANTLLGMASATGDERLLALLLERGAPVDGANVHGWTPLHQTGYADQPELAALLLDAGADAGAYGRGDGGTPLVAALFWGHRRVVEVLLRAGSLPRNLRVAAGTGDAALIGELLGTPDAGAHRGFYRPHSGFPEWQPSGDPQEVLDEALAYAARSDRPVGALIDAGARPEADVYRGTALAWAAAVGATSAMRELIERGAAVDGRSTFGGPSHGEAVTPLHLAAQSGEAAAVALLLDAGTDPTIVDGHGYGTPAGWAEHGGHPDLGARIRERVA